MIENKERPISKKQAINQLSKVKLVIGNGFDLQCGMHSSYKDYFDSVFSLNADINKWAAQWNIGFDALNPFLAAPANLYHTYWRKMENFNETNVWDCFFCFLLNENIENLNWCDIEAEIKKSFISRNKSHAFWELVFLIGQSPKLFDILGKDNRNILLTAAFIKYKRNGNWFSNVDDFFFFLLDELKLFENRFGEFINKQQTFQYNNNYAKLVTSLCNYNELVSIDSFNYSIFEESPIRQININGDYTKPIFGIDSKDISPDAPTFIFTKTYRRTEQDTDNKYISMDPFFENVVVYGHSLCSHDYSYFFPIMDKLKTYDFTAAGQIVFAYSVYDKDRESEIKTTHRLAIAKLIEAYANYRGIAQPNRLFDSLSIFRRIWIYELKT